MLYNNEWLKKRYEAGDTIKYLFFWGHQPSKDGSITKTCFSQWWVAPFEVDGIVYKTAEHWMMAGKARLFKDEAALEKILATPTPHQAKKGGRMVKNFVPAVWNEYKFTLVAQGNFHKFSQHENLKTFLLGTQNRVLVEASPMDNIWGIGMAADAADIENPLRWKGENLLGYALMQVREQLK